MAVVSRSTVAGPVALSVALFCGPAGAAPPAVPEAPVEDAPEVETEAEVPLPAPASTIEAAPLDGATRLDADGLFESEQRAYALYMEGVHAFEDDADYDAAIDKWTEAVATLPDERPYARSRGALALRLVTAHEKRFYRDGDLDDLRRQSALLLGYQQRLPEMFPDDSAARSQRHDHAQLRIDEIAAELERIEGEHGTVEEQLDRSLRGEYEARGDDNWRPDPTDAGWHARPDDPRKASQQATDRELAPEHLEPQQDEEEPEPPRKEGTGLLVSGAVLGAVGLGGIGVGVAGMVSAARANTFDPAQTPMQRRAQIVQGERGNVQALVGLAGGGALTVVGIVLVATGAAKRKRSASNVALSPMRTAGGWGATISGRF